MESLAKRLRRWRERLENRPGPGAIERPERLDELAGVVLHLQRRLREGAEAPVRLALFGPTGAGKSKIFNSLVGRELSPAGFRRPFTRETVRYLHRAWQSLEPSLDGEVVLHDDDRLKDVILTDTPDFDSVESANREEAERIFRESDAFIFVTDPLKYADASTWEYLDRVIESGRPFRALLNKSTGDDVFRDFEERLHRAGGLRPGRPGGIVVPELPIDDHAPIPPGDEGLVALGLYVQDVGATGEEGRRTTRAVFRGEVGRLVTIAGELLGQVRERRRDLSTLSDRLAERFAAGAESTRSRAEAHLSPAVRAEVYQRMLQTVEKIDWLRYPRRLLAMPVHGVRQLVRRWRGTGAAGAEAQELRRPPAASSESFQALESALLTASEATRSDFVSVPALRQRFTSAEYRRLRFGHDELVKKYEGLLESFGEWVAERAAEMAGELTTANRTKFILSQVIFNSVLLGVQIQTGGMLTLMELGFDSVLSPFVAKAVGMAISSEKVKEFEACAHEEYHRLVREIFDEARGRFQAFLVAAGEGLESLEETLAEMGDVAGHEDEVLSEFLGVDVAEGQE